MSPDTKATDKATDTKATVETVTEDTTTVETTVETVVETVEPVEVVGGGYQERPFPVRSDREHLRAEGRGRGPSAEFKAWRAENPPVDTE